MPHADFKLHSAEASSPESPWKLEGLRPGGFILQYVFKGFFLESGLLENIATSPMRVPDPRVRRSREPPARNATSSGADPISVEAPSGKIVIPTLQSVSLHTKSPQIQRS